MQQPCKSRQCHLAPFCGGRNWFGLREWWSWMSRHVLNCCSRSRNVEAGDSWGRAWLWEARLPGSIRTQLGDLVWRGWHGSWWTYSNTEGMIKETGGARLSVSWQLVSEDKIIENFKINRAASLLTIYEAAHWCCLLFCKMLIDPVVEYINSHGQTDPQT